MRGCTHFTGILTASWAGLGTLLWWQPERGGAEPPARDRGGDTRWPTG
jgi:hypothetical protein